MNNPLGLDLNNPDVVVINGNVINSAAPDNISLNANDSQYIYININSDCLNQEQVGQLQNLGVEVQNLVSKHAYLAKYRNSDLDVIRRLPFVRAANVYGAALKTVGTLKVNVLGSLQGVQQGAQSGDLTGIVGSTAQGVELRIVVQLHGDAPQTLDQVSQEISNRLGLNLGSLVSDTTGIDLTVRPDQLIQIESIDSVKRIEENVPVGFSNEYARGILGQNWDYTSVGHSPGTYRWKGRGVVVAVCDSGVDVSHRAFYGRVFKEANLHDPYRKCTNLDSTDPDGHGTHVAGSVVEGVAQECKILVQGTLKEDGNIGPTTTMYEAAFGNGADIHTNSWGPKWPGYQVGYTPSARAMDTATFAMRDQHRIMVVSAGNDGAKEGTRPDGSYPKERWDSQVGGNNGAKNAISVGLSLSLRPNFEDYYNVDFKNPDPRSVAIMSSCGPTLPEGGFEGRLKPDVVAPGTAILSCKSPSITWKNLQGYGYDKRDGNNGNRDGYIYTSGTSMATPHVAGCCAVIREALMSPLGGRFTISQPGGHLVKALLINGCVDLKGHLGGNGQPMPRAPNKYQGFGRVDLTNSLLHIERYNNKVEGTGFVDAGYGKPYDKPKPLKLNEWYTSDFITCETKVFSVTLCYYDDPGEVPQNKLNLVVYNGEDWNTYMRGNSNVIGNEGKIDQVNNVEKVVWERRPGIDSTRFRICVWASRMANPNFTQAFSLAWMSHE